MSDEINLSETTELETDKYIKIFIEDNQKYYLPKFSKFKTTDQKVSWNWAAFLFSSLWLFYRKQYWLVAIIWVVNIPFVFLPEPFYTGSELVNMVFCGLLGNYFYYRYGMRVISRSVSLPEEKRLKRLQRWGGTTMVGVFAYAVIWILLEMYA